ncbi:hypothetical protein [Janthinobacterium sp. B9-8]|uniref:hypothetical protein n=1 Tax=Janthinobacterium sp. B9-8 TaxID=1236179 RepID=UPI00061CFF46|nr:hypothetical protein [Janthinobacterium sp. B9-8]AMC34729.1 hypothetical protein VN23_08965 [Janthinobacterium sp. B9-8]
MTQYAYIRDGVVAHIAMSDKEEMTGLQSVVALPLKHAVTEGDRYDGRAFSRVTVTPTPATPPKLTPIQFKLCFTVQERLAIEDARVEDRILQDAYKILDDPRLTEVDLGLASTQQIIDYLVGIRCLSTERAEAVKRGVLL